MKKQKVEKQGKAIDSPEDAAALLNQKKKKRKYLIEYFTEKSNEIQNLSFEINYSGLMDHVKTK